MTQLVGGALDFGEGNESGENALQMEEMMAPAQSSARQRILDLATELFYQEGIRSVGIDTIVERSGVGKATLYRHFPTKNDLIVAYLEAEEDRYWQEFAAAAAPHEGSPREALIAWIDAMIERWNGPQYRGCAYLNALAEFADPGHPVHQRAVAHKRAVRERLYQMSQQLGARHPDALADQLILVINGGLASTPTFGSAGPVAQLKSVAVALIDAQIKDA